MCQHLPLATRKKKGKLYFREHKKQTIDNPKSQMTKEWVSLTFHGNKVHGDKALVVVVH